MNTIISKRTSPFTYTKWKTVNGQFYQDGAGIVINGGAGLVGGAELLSGIPLERRTSMIPVGVHTYVDDEVLERLMTIGKFVRDVERGIIVVVKGKKCDQDQTDNIASKDMVDDAHIPTRPVTQEEMEAAGGVKNKDGSIDIGEVNDGDSPLRQRKIDAGLPSYQKKANAEARDQRKAEVRRAYHRRSK